MTDLSNIKVLDLGRRRHSLRLARRDPEGSPPPCSRTERRRGCHPVRHRLAYLDVPDARPRQIRRTPLDERGPDSPSSPGRRAGKHSTLSLSESERDNLNDVWHRLSSWPDAADAIQKLRGRYTTVVLTVLSWSIVVDCSKHNAIDWDGILSCEFLGHYKTDAEAYLTALRLLRAEPSQAMMVAAHTGDLRGAKAAGLHTAYVHREGESDVFPRSSDTASAASEFDVVAIDFPDLADKLLA